MCDHLFQGFVRTGMDPKMARSRASDEESQDGRLHQRRPYQNESLRQVSHTRSSVIRRSDMSSSTSLSRFSQAGAHGRNQLLVRP